MFYLSSETPVLITSHPHLVVIWDVRVNVDVDVVRGQQLGVDSRGLTLDLPWMLQNVYLL